MKKGKVIVVMDGMAGSCGKGKIAGHIALTRDISCAINNFMSNAGHTFVFDSGDKVVTQHLPTSIVNPDTILCIGPGAAITPEILFNEIEEYSGLIGNRHIFIHPRAMVIKEKHREMEKQIIRSGSTFKGCGTAQADKIMRVPDIELFGDYMNRIYENVIMNDGDISSSERDILDRIVIVDTSEIVNSIIEDGKNVLVEGSQGADLDINYGLDYPHVTSRQCNVAQLVADCGMSPMLVTDVIMVIRPYPIRISNKTELGVDISSGDYDGSEEISWDIVKCRCGAPEDVIFGEMTTVTKKLRRVFEPNWDRLAYNCMINRPTEIVLNFAQYLDWQLNEMTNDNYSITLMPDSSNDIGEPFYMVNDFCDIIKEVTGIAVTMLGTGAKESQLIKL